MHVQLAENLSSVQQVLVLVDPVTPQVSFLLRLLWELGGATGCDVLLRIEGQERQVEQDGEPVTVDDEEEGQEGVDGSFRDDIGVETVAQVDRVDVVAVREGARVSDIPRRARELKISAASCKKDSPFQITVHDGEEHLEEQVDGIDQHRQQVEPRFARHDGHAINTTDRVYRLDVVWRWSASWGAEE